MGKIQRDLHSIFNETTVVYYFKVLGIRNQYNKEVRRMASYSGYSNSTNFTLFNWIEKGNYLKV